MKTSDFVTMNQILDTAGERILEIEKRFETLKGTFDRSVRTIVGLRADLDTRDDALESLTNLWVEAEEEGDAQEDQIETLVAAIAGRDSEISILRLRNNNLQKDLESRPLFTFEPRQWATIVESRDAQILDLQHDLAYAYEARANVLREFAAYRDRFRQAYEWTRKLALRAQADVLRKWLHDAGRSCCPSLETLRGVLRTLDELWRNAR